MRNFFPFLGAAVSIQYAAAAALSSAGANDSIMAFFKVLSSWLTALAFVVLAVYLVRGAKGNRP